MPRTNMGTVQKPFKDVAKVIKGNDGTATEVARALKCCYNTASDRLKHPENFTLGELKKISQRLHIPIEELRAAITW